MCAYKNNLTGEKTMSLIDKLARSSPEVTHAILEIFEEYLRACEQYPPIQTPHEGYGIILEELGEVWDVIIGEVWDVIKRYAGRPANVERENMRYEMKAVGAMALRFMLDLC